MKIAVIGAGIIGITTAYELAVDGHEVTVFERRGAAAEEASFANAGVVAPGSVTPWAAPGMPGKVLGNLLSRHSAVKLSLPLSGNDLAWMWKWWRACKLQTYLANRAQLQRLAFYSQARLHQLTVDLQLEYDRSRGYTVLLRSEEPDGQLRTSFFQVIQPIDDRHTRLFFMVRVPQTDPEELTATLRDVALIADEYDDKLMTKYGGQRMIDLLEEAAMERIMDKDPSTFKFE